MMHGIFRAITPGTQNINPQGKQCCNIGSLPCMHVDLILYAYMSKQKLAMSLQGAHVSLHAIL